MLSADDPRLHHVLLITMPYDPARSRGMPAKRRMRLVRLLRAVVATADLPVLFVAGQDSEFWPASHAAACAVLAPMGDSIVLAATATPPTSSSPRRSTRPCSASCLPPDGSNEAPKSLRRRMRENRLPPAVGGSSRNVAAPAG